MIAHNPGFYPQQQRIYGPGPVGPMGPGAMHTYRQMGPQPGPPMGFAPQQLPVSATSYQGGYPRQGSFSDNHQEPSCCGVGMGGGGPGGLCEPSQIAEQQWTYVGQGRGTHHCAPSYVFVGEGAGAWAREEKYFTNPRSYGCLWLLAGLMCFLATMAVALLISSILAAHGVSLPGAVHHHLRNAGHHIGNAAQAAGHHIGNAASSAHQVIKEHGPGVLEHVKNGASTVGHHVGNAARSAHAAVKEHGPGAWESVKKGAGTVAHHAGNAARSAGDAVKEHGPGFLEGVKHHAGNAASAAGNAASRARDAVQDARSNAGQ